jgi:TatD family hydrolase
VGVCTQDPKLRAKFEGSPEKVVNLFTFVAEEVREILASLGFKSLRDVIGRSDLLTQVLRGDESLDDLDRNPLLVQADPGEYPRYCTLEGRNEVPETLDEQMIADAAPALEGGEKMQLEYNIRNVYRAIGTKLSKFPGVRAIAEANANVFCTVGIHPHEASNEQAAVESLLALADHPKVVGIGETGLDYFYEKSPRAPQIENFRAHMRAAHASGLPLVIHTRDADADTGELLDWAHRELPGVTGVLHCFTSTLALAQKAIALGYYVSISGIVTFKNAEDLRATVRALPLERLFVKLEE